jgi:hypothetical protein
MKNKTERENFLKDYRKWGVWREINEPPVTIRIYRHDFKNGAFVTVTECDVIGYDDKPTVNNRYNLILPKADGYNPFSQNGGHSPREFLTYTLSGCGVTPIVDYMTKRKNEI